MSEIIPSESLIRQVEEITVTQNIDGTDVDFIAQLTTIPEGRVDGDYIVSIRMRRSHASVENGFNEECISALKKAVTTAFKKGEKNLEDYWGRAGSQQGNLFSDSGAKGKAKSDRAEANA